MSPSQARTRVYCYAASRPAPGMGPYLAAPGGKVPGCSPRPQPGGRPSVALLTGYPAGQLARSGHGYIPHVGVVGAAVCKPIRLLISAMPGLLRYRPRLWHSQPHCAAGRHHRRRTNQHTAASCFTFGSGTCGILCSGPQTHRVHQPNVFAMTIPYTPGHDYYTPFYLLATLTNVLLLLWEGWRRGFPLRPWLTLVAASSLALILGSKLITHPVGEWATVLFSNAPPDTARSILGGSLAACYGAGPAPLAGPELGRARCAGPAAVRGAGGAVRGLRAHGLLLRQPTTGAWGLTYAAGTLPWAAQVQAGLLPATAAHSLPVAPTQLWRCCCAPRWAACCWLRRRRWPVGSWLLLQTGLLLLGRLAQVLARPPASPWRASVHPVLGGQWLELQLRLLPLGLVALGVWAWRVHRPCCHCTHCSGATGSGAAATHGGRVAGHVVPHGCAGPPGPYHTRSAGGARPAAHGADSRRGHSCLVSPASGLRLAGLPLSVAVGGVVLLTTAQAPAPARAAADISGTTRTTNDRRGIGQRPRGRWLGSLKAGRLRRQPAARRCNNRCGRRAAKWPSKRGGFGHHQKWGGGVWLGQQQIDVQPIPNPMAMVPRNKR